MLLYRKRVLVLNQNYEPMYICNAKRAIVLIYLGKVDIVESEDGLEVHSPSVTIPMPSIIRLINYRKIPKKKVSITRNNLLIRDSYQCQYCSIKPTKNKDLTIDHIIPRSQDGKHLWTNLVVACIKCNVKKRNRTPEQANMELIRKPLIPNYVMTLRFYIGYDVKDSWKPYMFIT